MTLLHQAAQKAVEAALRRAFNLGLMYWQQADSESRAQNRQAEITQSKFDALVAQTLSALQQQPEPVANISNGLRRYVMNYASGEMAESERGPWVRYVDMLALYGEPPALQQQEVPREPVAWMHEYTDPHTGERARQPRKNKPTEYEMLPGELIWPLYASPCTTQQQEARSGPSGETEAQREEVCRAWADLPDALRCHPGLKRLYRALGGVHLDDPAAAPSTPENAAGVTGTSGGEHG